MKCKIDRVEIGLDREATLTLTTTEKPAVAATWDQFHDTDIEVTIAKYHKKRSLKSNTYLWELIGKIAVMLRIPKDEVYTEMVKQNGIFTAMTLLTDAVEGHAKRWSKMGLGWKTDIIGRNREDSNMTDIVCYYGTSVYNASEFALIVDSVIEQCKENGIAYETGALRALLEDGEEGH